MALNLLSKRTCFSLLALNMSGLRSRAAAAITVLEPRAGVVGGKELMWKNLGKRSVNREGNLILGMMSSEPQSKLA